MPKTVRLILALFPLVGVLISSTTPSHATLFKDEARIEAARAALANARDRRAFAGRRIEQLRAEREEALERVRTQYGLAILNAGDELELAKKAYDNAERALKEATKD